MTAGNLDGVVEVEQAPGGRSGPLGKLRRLRSAGMTRSLWNIGDQVVASLNNFLIQFVITHAFTKDVFGAFAIAFSVFSISTGFFRALSTSPVAMRFADADDREFSRAAGSAVALTASGSALVGVVLVLMGWLLPFGESLSHVFIALGFVLPGLMLQDAWRQVFFARLRPPRRSSWTSAGSCCSSAGSVSSSWSPTRTTSPRSPRSGAARPTSPPCSGSSSCA